MTFKKLQYATLVLAAAAITSCTGYNSTDIKDRNMENERVYGEKGGPARQLAQEYPDDPNAIEAANTIRAKWWPEKGMEAQMDTMELDDMIDSESSDMDVATDTAGIMKGGNRMGETGEVKTDSVKSKDKGMNAGK